MLFASASTARSARLAALTALRAARNRIYVMAAVPEPVLSCSQTACAQDLTARLLRPIVIPSVIRRPTFGRERSPGGNMPEYALRNIDPTLWSRFTERANREGWPTKALLVALMDGYANDDINLGTPPPRELPQFAWLRSHYRQVASAEDFSSLGCDCQWERLVQQVLHSAAAMSWHSLDEVPQLRRTQVLRWLQQTSDLPVRHALTLRAIAHIGEGPDLRTNRRAFQFEVLGLPAGQQAWIADFDGGWRVLRVVDGKQGGWSPNPFEDKAEALNVLADAIDRAADE
jgi:hypothetical protein